MNKRRLSLLIVLCLIISMMPMSVFAADASVKINSTNFPDSQFREYLKAQSYGSDSVITASELKTITKIDLSEEWDYDIKDLTGVNKLKYLTELNFSWTSVNTLPAVPSSLEKLDCSYACLEELPELPAGLTYLDCSSNEIETLPELPSTLTYLDCRYNLLEEIGTLPEGLKTLDISGNYFEELPELPEGLENLDFGYNYIETIPTNLPDGLVQLECYGNYMAGVLDVSAMDNLELLDCYDNILTGVKVSSAAPLEYLDVSYNFLSSKDDIEGCDISSIDEFYYDDQYNCEEDSHCYNFNNPVVAKKATMKAEGVVEYTCCGCDSVYKEAIPQIKSVKLSYSKVTYNGKIKKTTVTVKGYDSEYGEYELPEGWIYTTSYAKGRTAVGRYKVTIKFDSEYFDIPTQYRYFTIVPKAPASVKATLYGYDDVKVSWDKVSNATGYYVYYKKASASEWTYLTRTTGTSAKKANLSDGVKYTFKVVPYYYCSSNQTRYKSTQYETASVTTLKEVKKPTVTTSSGKVKIKWTDISGESGYQVQKLKKVNGKYVNVAKYTTTSTSKTVTATKGTGYYYRVRAYKIVNGDKVYGPWSDKTYYKR